MSSRSRLAKETPSIPTILYVCHDGALYGSQQSLLLMLQSLRKEEYRVVVSLARGGPLEAILEAWAQSGEGPHVTLVRHQRVQWVKHDRRNPLQQLGDMVSTLFQLVQRVPPMVRVIRDRHVALVHTNSMVSLEGACAAFFTRVPHVWHIRELFMWPSPKLHLVWGRELTRWMIHGLSSHVFCVSQVVRQQFKSFLKPEQIILMENKTAHSIQKKETEKYEVLYNAFNLEKPDSPVSHTNIENETPLPSKSAAFRLGYVGRLSAGKRIHDLLDALCLIQEEGHSVELVLAGNFVDEHYEQQVRQQIKQLGLHAVVHFLGFQQDTTALFQSLDVLVLPSVNEPFGRVLVEAMAHHVPAVGANSGGIPEIITHQETGWLFPPKDIAALARTLREVMNNPELRQQVQQHARRMVLDRFTIEAQGRVLDKTYRRLIRRSQQKRWWQW